MFCLEVHCFIQSFGRHSTMRVKKQTIVWKGTWIMYLPMDDKQCKNTSERFRHLVSSSGKRRKTNKNKKKKEAEKRTYESPVRLPPRLSSSLLLSSFCCCLSFFFYLTKTLSVESAHLYFSHRLSSIDEYIFQDVFFLHVSTSPAVTRFFFRLLFTQLWTIC